MLQSNGIILTADRRRGLQRSSGRGRCRTLLPVAAFFERVDDLTRHVTLIMLGEHGRGGKYAVRLQPAFSDDPLPFAEQVGQDAAIDDGNVVFAVRDAE